MSKGDSKSKLHKLDSLSIRKLPEEMRVFEFSVGGKAIRVDLDEMLTLGDGCEDPFQVLHALDDLPAMKAFFGTQLAHAEERVARTQEALSAAEGGAKEGLYQWAMAAQGKAPSADRTKDLVSATARRLASAREKDADAIREEIAEEYGEPIVKVCNQYREAALCLRQRSRQRDLLRQTTDALSSRSFTMTKIADLLGDTMHLGLIDVGSIAPHKIRPRRQKEASRKARERRGRDGQEGA